jgi:hypothetical protein
MLLAHKTRKLVLYSKANRNAPDRLLTNRGEAKTYRIIFVVVSFHKQLSEGNK